MKNNAMLHPNPSDDGYAARRMERRIRPRSARTPDSNSFHHMRLRIELIATLMMTLAAVLSAWCIYQTNNWYGVMSLHFAEANAHLAEALRDHREIDRVILNDLTNVKEWATAMQAGDHQLASALEGRFHSQRPSQQPARLSDQPDGGSSVAAPSASESPEHEIDHEEQNENLAHALKTAFAYAEQASRNGDEFLLAIVLFSTALLFSAMTVKTETAAVQVGLLTVSELFTVAGVLTIIGLPVIFGA